MQDDNQLPNLQPSPSGSLVNSSKVIQPISTDLTNPSVSPVTNANASPDNHTMQSQAIHNTVSSNYNSAAVYPNVAQDTQNAPLTTTTSSDTFIGLTGSQIQQQKTPLPIGVYIIAGFNLVGFVIGFFDTSQNSAVYTIVMLFDLLLAIGLLLRLEVARKSILWLEGVTLVLTIAGIFLLIGLQQRIAQLKTNYDAAISRIDQSRLTSTQKQQLNALQTAIGDKEKQTGRAITFTYFKLGATATATIAVMVYLTRPKVKEVFHELEA